MNGPRRLLLWHAALQCCFLIVLALIPPGGWLHALWQSLAGCASAVLMVVGIRRFRPQSPLPWYLIAAGMLLSALGTTVEMIAWRCCQVITNPNVADGFWLSLHASLIIALGIFVYRRAATEELGTGTLTTIACALLNLFVGVFAWQSIVWRAQSDHSLTLANRFIVTLYPLADLMVIALVLRLLFGKGLRNASLLLVAAALGCFLSSDVGWSDFIRSHSFPDRWREFSVEATSMLARALLGAATLLPSVRKLSPPVEGPVSGMGVLGWVGIGASALTAPVVLALQALLDRLYSVASF
jgi:hypothetical protein